MANLPLIVGFGGYSPAGRSSFHHAYARTVLESLPPEKITDTLLGLATMMKLVRYENGHYVDADDSNLSPKDVVQKYQQQILQSTLIRSLEPDFWPESDPEHCDVNAVGPLPKGLEPKSYYPEKQHPRGLQMTVLAASDALMSTGIPWSKILETIDPTEVSVYAGSVMSQLDANGFGNMMQAQLKGKKVKAKNLPLGLSSMPADFINAYVLGSLGKTGGINGACATFLYNLDRAANDIRTGASKVSIVGNSEAPLTPEVIEGYAAMGALATDTKLRHIQQTDTIDYHSASRPFGDNGGFILSESAQYLVLMSDDLAIELGARIHGMVGEVFIAADGFKSSISAPGPGNYITLAKAVVSAMKAMGEESVTKRSFVQAHGSSTPQNRTTESAILNKIATSMGIESWPVTAVKSYVGHSLSAASADQTINSLGVFKHHILPGIKTSEKIADDVTTTNLSIQLSDTEQKFDLAFINSKGFGGNNATAYLVSPDKTREILAKRYSSDALSAHNEKLQYVTQAAERYNEAATQGALAAIYTTASHTLGDEEVSITADSIQLGEQTIKLR